VTASDLPWTAPATAPELRALLRKYTTLVRWRLARDHEGAAGPRTPRPIAGATVPAPATLADPASGGDWLVATAPQLRQLAREFPGCLRELDRLGLAELERRVERLHAWTNGTGHAESAPGDVATVATAAGERWLPWILTFHALMRAALQVKASLSAERRRRGRPAPRVASAGTPASADDRPAGPTPAEAEALARQVSAAAAIAVDAAFIAAVARPPEGRLATVVLHEVGARFGATPTSIGVALFPPRHG